MIKLFCIPGGGTPSTTFYKWVNQMDSQIEICMLEYPGRGVRKNEPAVSSVDELADDFYMKICSEISSCEYMLLSSCTGTILEYEIYRRILENNDKLPIHMFVFSAEAPNGDLYKGRNYVSERNRDILYKTYLSFFKKEIFDNPEEAANIYVSKLINLNKGVEKLVFPSEEVLHAGDNLTFEQSMILDFANQTIKMLNDDWIIAKEYSEKQREYPLISCPLSVVYGSDDISLRPDSICSWKGLSLNKFNLIKVAGDHNLITENPDICIKVINDSFKSKSDNIVV